MQSESMVWDMNQLQLVFITSGKVKRKSYVNQFMDSSAKHKLWASEHQVLCETKCQSMKQVNKITIKAQKLWLTEVEDKKMIITFW